MPIAPPLFQTYETAETAAHLHDYEHALALAEPASWAAAPAPPPAQRGSLTFPFRVNGGDVGVGLVMRPVIDLARGAAVADHVTRIVRDPIHPAMDQDDQTRLDCQTLRHALSLVKGDAGAVGVAPLSWRTAACSRGRFSLLYACMDAPLDASRYLIAELTELDPAVEPARLAEVLSMLRVRRRGVMTRVDARTLPLVQAVRAQGVSLDLAGLDTRSPAGWRTAEGLISAARAGARRVVTLDLAPERRLAAADAGATHAVFDHMAPVLA